MRVLLLGGTGAMGMPLMHLLDEHGHNVVVTSRREQQPYGNVKFIIGDAKDDAFFDSIVKEHYDAIIDFMVYHSDAFEQRLPKFLMNTDQYFFFSSSRVYADSIEPLTEDSPRLLDVCKDESYLATDEYALAKAREENLLLRSEKRNWTIIRPYITYNDKRLQLGVYEKENWLYRGIRGRSIVLPKDIADSYTTLTLGNDVANAIYKLIGNRNALGEIFHITADKSLPWRDVLEIYKSVYENWSGKRFDVILTEDSEDLQRIWNSAQIKYDRLYNRIFNNSKIVSATGVKFICPEQGLKSCLETFLSSPEWLQINWRFEAWADKQAHEWETIKDMTGVRPILRYIKNRLS